MQLKSILLALGIGAAGLTLSGCVSESYYGTSGGYYDPYYVRGGYVGSAIIYDSGRYRAPRRYHSYRHNHRPNRPDYNRLTARTGPITIGQIARTGPAGRIGRMCAPVTAAPAAVAITGQGSTPPNAARADS
ncbi:Uncharacterised protein [Brucella neotomae]|uniref:Lipoprotein n=1 Tax=Brucella neotomae 5K33 TaxID=520456 RepID=A0A7U8K968_BRUNE|nr:predicted protein [Brucella neotomae 5K33]KFJ59021.1 hypothetical protein DK64_2172 [Brucella neotomae 5K33]SPU66090.1 Uncharacterised protein [Brucella neotomae]SPU66246.1 Uncharacterised protein [Brucella neotomae]SUW39553.1 Uncharacterised protein [Brucella neotomae]